VPVPARPRARRPGPWSPLGGKAGPGPGPSQAPPASCPQGRRGARAPVASTGLGITPRPSHSRTGLLGEHPELGPEAWGAYQVGPSCASGVIFPSQARVVCGRACCDVSVARAARTDHTAGPASAACRRKPATISTHSLSAELQLLDAIPGEPAASNGTAMPAQQPTCAEPSEPRVGDCCTRKPLCVGMATSRCMRPDA
jgi:hypothetical protein